MRPPRKSKMTVYCCVLKFLVCTENTWCVFREKPSFWKSSCVVWTEKTVFDAFLEWNLRSHIPPEWCGRGLIVSTTWGGVGECSNVVQKFVLGSESWWTYQRRNITIQTNRPTLNRAWRSYKLVQALKKLRRSICSRENVVLDIFSSNSAADR